MSLFNAGEGRLILQIGIGSFYQLYLLKICFVFFASVCLYKNLPFYKDKRQSPKIFAVNAPTNINLKARFS